MRLPDYHPEAPWQDHIDVPVNLPMMLITVDHDHLAEDDIQIATVSFTRRKYRLATGCKIEGYPILATYYKLTWREAEGLDFANVPAHELDGVLHGSGYMGIPYGVRYLLIKLPEIIHVIHVWQCDKCKAAFITLDSEGLAHGCTEAKQLGANTRATGA